MIYEGNSFSATGVMASDRGHYIANISNIAGNMTIEYEVLIRCKSCQTIYCWIQLNICLDYKCKY